MVQDTDQTDDVLEALAALPTLAHPTAANTGERVAFYYDVTGRNELHVLDVESGEMEQWSDGDVPRSAHWFVDWAADDERIFFHQDDGGNEQNDIHAISRDGDVEPVVEMEGQIELRDVGDDGETLLVASNRDGQMNLYRHDLEADETTKITDYDRSVSGSILSPGCDRVAYETNESDNFDNKDVYVANVDGSNPRNLDIGQTGAEAEPVVWGPDGRRLLVSDNSADLGRIGVYELETAEIAWLGTGEFEETPVAFMPCGDRVVGTRARDAESIPVVYELDSEGSDLDSEGSDLDSEGADTNSEGSDLDSEGSDLDSEGADTNSEGTEFDLPGGFALFGSLFGQGGNPVLDDDRVVLTHQTPTRRSELLAYDVSTHEFETLVEAEYGPFDPDDFANVEYFTVQSNGIPETTQAAVEHDPYRELEIGALFFDSGRRPSPLIVNPHGGPRGRDVKLFNVFSQVLVSLGFSVLQVNYRGSTGRGREFVEALFEDWGGAEQGDVAVAVECVLERYDWLDDEQVVVFGGSYGGYSAYWQLVQYPDLYEAGISWVGVSDLEDMYENTMPHYQTELMEKYLGTPEENPDLYEERSPITHVENLDAPLLIGHGVNDPRVPVSQARLFRDALADAGFEAGPGGEYEYHELGEEGHGSSDQDQKLRMFSLLADFLERRVGTEPKALVAD